MKKAIINLDLSLRRTGICSIPTNWAGDMREVVVEAVPCNGTPHNEEQVAQRLDLLRKRIVPLALDICPRVEAWGINPARARSPFANFNLGQLDGVIRVELLRRGQVVRNVQESAARKLLCGSGGGAGIKELIKNVVNSFDGCASWQFDEVDAFVGANWLMRELGYWHLEA